MISVIIPVYKVEQYLDRCVQSVVNQSYSNLEIILVDDGSPDNCPSKCDDWAEKDHRIKVIHKQNGGLSDARNAGMGASTGEYIAFVDSDDWIAPEMMERLLNSIQQDKSDISACTVEMVWQDGTPSRLLTVQTSCLLNRLEAQNALLEESLLKQPVWYKLYRRKTIQSIPFEVGKFHEDVFWSYQAIGNANSVSLIDYIGYFYVQRPGSIMGDSYSIKRLDALKARERWFGYVVSEFPELREKALVKLWENCMYHGQMSLRYLAKSESSRAFALLNEIIKRHSLHWREYSGQEFTHRVWLSMTKISLVSVCRIRNVLGIGL